MKRPRSSLSDVSNSNSSSAATIVADGMREAVQQLRISKASDDEFDTFGRYVATELRSLNNVNVARKIRLKINRFLMDLIEGETNSMPYIEQQQPQYIVVNVPQSDGSLGGPSTTTISTTLEQQQ